MNWSVFTIEEQEYIKDIAKKGEWGSMASAIRVQTPEQEYWLNYFMDENRPVVIVQESKVKKELDIELSKNPIGDTLNTPEKEAEWQAKLDAEKAEHEEKAKEVIAKKRGRKKKEEKE